MTHILIAEWQESQQSEFLGENKDNTHPDHETVPQKSYQSGFAERNKTTHFLITEEHHIRMSRMNF